MKKLLLVIFLFVSAWSYGQSIQSQQIFNSSTDLLATKGNDGVIYKLANLTSAGDGRGGEFVYKASSTNTVDNINILSSNPTNPGRFERMPNTTLIFGSSSVTGVALQQSYSVVFNTPLLNNNYIVIPIITSDNISFSPTVPVKTTTGFTLRFTAVPTVGASITFDYLVKIKTN